MKYTLFLLSLFLSVWVCAVERTMEEAAIVAERFSIAHGLCKTPMRSKTNKASLQCVHQQMHTKSSHPAYYVFNQADESGFVIVSADSRTEDILAYSNQGAFDWATINPHFRFWLDALQTQMMQVTDDAASEPSTQPAKTVIEPLLVNQNGTAITWNQYAPYNQYCPMDMWDTTRCLTGCVATAMGQIMYKWRYPKQGIGTKTYLWGNYYKRSQSEYLTANFGATTYDWDNMLPAYEGVSSTSAQKNAVATLLYHLGIACEMEYGGERARGSAAWTDQMADGLVKYFDYKVDKYITMYTEEDYTAARPCAFPNVLYEAPIDTFYKYIDRDLEAGWPVIMGGEGSYGAHEFVCDGRDADGLYHMNWGWEGSGNCYCLLTVLKPQGKKMTFSNNLDALVGVRPTSYPSAVPMVETQQQPIYKYVYRGSFIIERNHTRWNILGQTRQ